MPSAVLQAVDDLIVGKPLDAGFAREMEDEAQRLARELDDLSDPEVGRKIARTNAINKVWPLMGYELRSKLAGL